MIGTTKLSTTEITQQAGEVHRLVRDRLNLTAILAEIDTTNYEDDAVTLGTMSALLAEAMLLHIVSDVLDEVKNDKRGSLNSRKRFLTFVADYWDDFNGKQP